MSREHENIILSLVAAMNACRLYPGHHPSIKHHTTEALTNLKLHMVQRKVVIDVEENNALRINGASLAVDTAETKKLFVKLRQRGVARIIFGKRLDAGELLEFLSAISASGGSLGSYQNIAVSLAAKTETAGQGPVGQDVQEIYAVRKLFREMLNYKNVDMESLDVTVGGILAGIRKNQDLSRLMIPDTGGGNHLFVHAFNVALLSLFQAEHIGLGSSLLYDIGFAALVHDIGKTLLPRQVEERQDSLDEEGWMLMKKHPVYGAALLSSMKKVPDIAVVVAFEHHLKYDGTGYPESRQHARKPHLITQIVGLADWYCALSADLPHRKPLEAPVILGLLAGMAGKEFNPLLIDNLVHAVSAGR